MIVDARIQNTPANVRDHGFIVARVAEDHMLWWYGIYDTREKARTVARDIGNGIVLERKTAKMGKWLHKNDDYCDWLECSECGYGEEGEVEYDTGTSYCPNCGAKMERKEEQ